MHCLNYCTVHYAPLHGEGSCLWNLSTKLMLFFDVCSVLAIFSVVYQARKMNKQDAMDHGGNGGR